MFKTLREDIDATMARDPAARSRLEVALCYPGFQALLIYRLANSLWRRRFHLLGRWVSQIARLLTGIEIHPGAIIGRRLFIDHGMGVVIGETAEIGDDVTLYHDVTLGGVAPSIDSDQQRNQKRHPTLQDNVIVGSGAQVLGPITVARCARVGANAVVTKDVAAGVTVVGVPARAVGDQTARLEAADARFVAYGTPTGDIPDPVARALDGLLNEVHGLRAQVRDLEAKLGEQAGPKPTGSERAQAKRGVAHNGEEPAKSEKSAC
ncbi:serine O-acetyltransferase [Algihabitans albus]|uniref:serine O-acetyltransferase n=1 Tax=Algihabitans albus TaxID=2164067 RepID=UPI000E5C5D4A|nr:serine O-acetyltransferase [Algihabitans albus]